MTQSDARDPSLVAGIGSLALILGALAFQYLGGVQPCHLCILQRIPHCVAIFVALLVLLIGARRAIVALGVLTMLVEIGLAAYHSGVERGLWEGPTTCTSSPIGGLSADQLMNQIMTAPLVQCDQISWSFIGLSMANWNLIFSCGLLALWVIGFRRAR